MNFMKNTLVQVFAVAALISVVVGPSLATQWKTVPGADTVVRLKGWPEKLRCTFRDGGYNANFSQKRTRVYCRGIRNPDLPHLETARTFIRINELQPGFYWGGSYSKDVRQLVFFQKTTGFFSYFKSAKFDEGQEFKCYNSPQCRFRHIRFTVDGQSCQWVAYNPDIGVTDGQSGSSNTPFNVTLIHCGSNVPFQQQHFSLAPDTVTILHSDPAGAAAFGTIPNQLVCRMAVNGDGSAWQPLGFDKYVDVAKHRGLSVADCQNVLTRAARRDESNNPPTADNKSRANSPFANCFDNPQNCK